MELNFIRLIFSLKLEGAVTDRFALFGMRPHFEEAFRATANCGEGGSGLCAKGEGCPYHQAFSRPLSVDPVALKRYQKPALPFAFQIPLLPDRGGMVELGLILAGTAANFVTDYLAAIERMLRSPAFHKGVPASLMKVESAGYGGMRSLIMQPGEEMAADLLATLSLQGLRESALLPPDVVTVNIVTPLRIMAEGRPLREFSFSPFIRALFRRVSSMAYYCGGSEAELDFKWLAGESRLVECANADFRWVEWGNKWGGLIGEATFTGNLTEYHPFLLAGEYLNVGKGSSFGLGRYTLGKSG